MDIGFHAAMLVLGLASRGKSKQPDKVDRVLNAVSVPLSKFIQTAWRGQQVVGRVKELTGIDLLADDKEGKYEQDN